MAETVLQLRKANIYQGQSLVLREVDITVQKSEFVYLVGKTGTGKSSLLKTLYGELELREGEGMVAGYDLKTLTWKTVPFLRRTIGIVFQDFQLLTDRNVMENLMFVLEATGWKNRKQMEEKINDVLAKVGLRTKGFKFPFELSGGEQQRVDIARALLNSPKLILADEPTGNLDAKSATDVLSILQALSRDSRKTVIMVTHDPKAAGYGTRSLHLEKGEIVA